MLCVAGASGGASHSWLRAEIDDALHPLGGFFGRAFVAQKPAIDVVVEDACDGREEAGKEWITADSQALYTCARG